MSKLVVVPFDDKEGRLQGDSSWNPEIYFPYEEGMTVADVRTQACNHLMKNWNEQDRFESVEEFAEEYMLECTGGWVIEEDKLDIINSWDVDVGSDSALYAMIKSCKSQVASSAEFVIEDK